SDAIVCGQPSRAARVTASARARLTPSRHSDIRACIGAGSSTGTRCRQWLKASASPEASSPISFAAAESAGSSRTDPSHCTSAVGGVSPPPVNSTWPSGVRTRRSALRRSILGGSSIPITTAPTPRCTPRPVWGEESICGGGPCWIITPPTPPMSVGKESKTGAGDPWPSGGGLLEPLGGGPWTESDGPALPGGARPGGGVWIMKLAPLMRDSAVMAASVRSRSRRSSRMRYRTPHTQRGPPTSRATATPPAASRVSRARMLQAMPPAHRPASRPRGLPVRLEPVPEAAQRRDAAASERSVHLLAEVADVDLDDVVVALVVEAPDGIEDRLLGVNDARMAHQELEKRALSRGELDDRVPSAADAGSGVQLQVSDPQQRPRLLAPPPQQRVDARDQHGVGEGLRHVVVGTEVEPAPLALLAVPCREHQDRRGDTGFAQAGADLESAHAGQHHVEQ